MKSCSATRPCNAWALSAVTLAVGLAACGGSDAPIVAPITGPAIAPVITTQPQSLSVAAGGQGSVSVAATSDAGAIVYQWFNVSANANISGATAASYSFGPVSLTAQAAQYNARLTNSVGTTPSTTATLSALDAAVAVSGSDGFDFVWRERLTANGVHDVKARRDTISSSSFGAIESLEASATETRAPRLVADAAGNVLAAWTFVSEGVVINRRAAGAAWSQSTTFVGSGLPLEVLKSAANGKAVLLTSDRLGDVQAARLDLAAVNPLLGAAEIVSNAYGSAPDAFIDNNGRIDVVGVHVPVGNGDTSTVFHRSYLPATGWSSAQALSPVNPSDFVATGLGLFDPTVAGADAQGNLIVTWQERQASGDEPLSQVHARRFHAPLNQWRTAVQVGSSSNRPARTAIAPEGGATVVYQNPTATAVLATSLR